MPEAGEARKRRWFWWPVRIGLGFLGFVVLMIAGLFLWKPEATLLLLEILFHPLLENTRPPTIAADQFGGATFQNQRETNAKLNALFQQKFPAGTSEGTLKATLLGQGFKPLPPPRPDCLPQGQRAPVGQAFTTCPTYDQSEALEYRWGSGICGDTITVIWSTDESQKVRDVKASYYGACL